MLLLLGIPCVLLCGYLWHQGGQGDKWKRVMVGGLIGLVKTILFIPIDGWWAVLAMFYWLALWTMTSLFSYGISAPPHKFWVWIFGEGELTEVLTRATCGFFWSLAGLVFAFITGNWIIFGLYVILSTVLVTVFGRVDDVEISETGTGMSVALSVFI